MGIKYIDWSCKHDILIHNPDGTFSPMDEPYFRSEPVRPGVWKILSSGDYSYLIEGGKKAIAVDTGYGAGNIREYMQSLTVKPLSEVINSHDHFDHTANNAYFDKAYMSEATVPLATVPFASFDGIYFPKDYVHAVVREGDIIDLGGSKTLEVFEIPDHAVGSIALLDRADRILFTGDEFMPMPAGKRLAVSIETFMGYLEKLAVHRNEFDILCGGSGVLDASLLDSYRTCAKYILDGNTGEPDTAPGGPPIIDFSEQFPGRTVYDRMLPHPGDGGAHTMYECEKYRRVVHCAGVKISYIPTETGENRTEEPVIGRQLRSDV